jgi:hypothetical protein
VYYPAEGDRVVITRYKPAGAIAMTWLGTVTDVMPYTKDHLGTWMGGWTFTGRELRPGGKDTFGAWTCSEALLLHYGARQSVRPATPDEETT